MKQGIYQGNPDYMDHSLAMDYNSGDFIPTGILMPMTQDTMLRIRPTLWKATYLIQKLKH